MITIRYTKTEDCFDIPKQAHAGDAAADGYAAEDAVIDPGDVKPISLGFKCQFPDTHALLVLPRSGLSLKGITIANTPGLIDSSYRGVVKALVLNDSLEWFEVKRGDRICQLLLVPVPYVNWEETTSLDESERGANGFGSSGV